MPIKPKTPKTRTAKDRIFISYRRTDTEGYAGRLEDALKRYFGKDRVFRDVGAIEPGEDYTVKIERSLEGAGVVIVLMGPNWFAGSESGKSRLRDPSDVLAKEITAALSGNCRVIPVLVQGARMPSEDDLPDALTELTRRNAVTITDEGWDTDVRRLAKVLALDVSGSVAERRINSLKLGAVSFLFVPMAVSLVLFARANLKGEDFGPFLAGLNPMFIIAVTVWLAARSSWVEESVRKFIWVAVGLGFLGITFTWILYIPLTQPYEGVIAITLTTIIASGMLALMVLSGFKPDDSLR